jgi:uncharacterized membrane protein
MRLRELEHELEAWTAEGLVSPEQAAAIRSRYAREAPAATRGRIVRVVSAVGAVVAGLGVVLFVAANWDGMPRPTRVVLLLALVVAAYGAGYALRERRGTHPHVGEALYLLGGLAFAAEIFLVGQMYHVDAHWPLAFLAIALLTGAVAAVVRAQALAALSLVALGVWPLTELSELGGDAGLYAPVAAALYGCALYGLGTGDRGVLRRAGFRAPMRALGLPLLLVGTFVFTFEPAHDAVDDAAVDGRALAALVALAVAAGAGAAALALLPEGRRTAPWEAAALLATEFLVVLAVLAPVGSPDGGSAVLYPILFNLLFAALALGAIVVGSVEDEPGLVAVGLVAVGVDVLARYFDFFWDFLPRSLGFVGAGLLLLGLAWLLERQRSRLVGSMR